LGIFGGKEEAKKGVEKWANVPISHQRDMMQEVAIQ